MHWFMFSDLWTHLWVTSLPICDGEIISEPDILELVIG